MRGIGRDRIIPTHVRKMIIKTKLKTTADMIIIVRPTLELQTKTAMFSHSPCRRMRACVRACVRA